MKSWHIKAGQWLNIQQRVYTLIVMAVTAQWLQAEDTCVYESYIAQLTDLLIKTALPLHKCYAVASIYRALNKAKGTCWSGNAVDTCYICKSAEFCKFLQMVFHVWCYKDHRICTARSSVLNVLDMATQKQRKR